MTTHLTILFLSLAEPLDGPDEGVFDVLAHPGPAPRLTLNRGLETAVLLLAVVVAHDGSDVVDTLVNANVVVCFNNSKFFNIFSLKLTCIV